MSKFKYIDDGLWQAERDIKNKLELLEEDIVSSRETTRYHNSRYHSERKSLRLLNNKKDRLKRQLAKAQELRASLNPTPPTPKSKITEVQHER